MVHKILVSFVFASLLIIPLVSAELDRFFSVYDVEDSYEALPGESVVVLFTLQNQDMLAPRNVIAYIDPCPYRWTCESRMFSWNRSDRHDVNLTIQVPAEAVPNKYSMRVLLTSEDHTLRGHDNFVVSVLSEKQAKTLSFEEYKAKYESPVKVEDVPEPASPDPVPSVLEIGADDDDEEAAPEEDVGVDGMSGADDVTVEESGASAANTSDIMDDIERLESSRHFVEYASVVLVIVLVFIAAGAYMTFRKD